MQKTHQKKSHPGHLLSSNKKLIMNSSSVLPRPSLLRYRLILNQIGHYLNLGYNLALNSATSAMGASASLMLRSLTALVIIGGAGAILATAGVLALSWWQPSSQYSTDLWLNQGWSLTINTIALATTVLGGTWFLGGLLATLTTFVNFKGKALALMLALAPLTIPSYVLGFFWLSWFDYTGPLQKALRWWDHDHTLDLIGNGFAGLALSMIFSLFPYVFIIVRVQPQ